MTEIDTPQSEKQTERRALIPAGPRGIELHSLNDFYRFAEYVVAAGAVPAGLNGVAGVIIALQRGAEVGLLPMQSLQSIYVVNNMPQLFGDAPKGIVLATGLMEKCDEFTEGVYPDDNFKAVCIVKRRGFTEKRSEFSIGDARTAKLWEKQSRDGKPSPWILYPKRMLRWRALGYALRDEFSDVLKGFPIRELMDEADNAFEHAKPAQGRVVAPNFEVDKDAPAAAAERLAQSAREREQISDAKESPKESAGNGKPADSMAQTPPQPAKRGPGRPRKANLFDPPKPVAPTTPPEPPTGPELSKSAAEVLRRLQADDLPLANFIKLMQRNQYVEGEGNDLANVAEDGLDQALAQWPQVALHLREMKDEEQRTPFA